MTTVPPTRGWRARSRALLIAAIVVVLLGAAALIGYLQSRQPKGTSPSGKAPPDVCQLSERTLQGARTSNFSYFTASDSGHEKYFRCDWDQTRGKDGIDARDLSLQIHGYTGTTAEQDARTGFDIAKAEPHSVQPAQIKDAPGIGEQAMYQIAPSSRDATSVTLVARKAATVIAVTYRGSDQGFFWATPMPAADGEKVTAMVAQEVLSRP